MNHPSLFNEYRNIVPHRGKMLGWESLAVYGNPHTEFKRAIELARSWAKNKSIKSFDVLSFQPIDRNGVFMPLWKESTGCARFLVVSYANLSGAFHMDLWQ